MNKLFTNSVLFVLFSSLFFLFFGCISDSSIPGIPFTTSQLINRSTDLNYTKFINNDYNGLCLLVDGNVLTAGNCSGASSIDWNSLTNFPAPCPSGFAVQIIGSTLTCISVGDVNSNLDGGFAASTYRSDQNVNGGNASS